MKLRASRLLASAASLFLTAGADAQQPSPRLDGLVVDDAGTPVPGAPVLLHRLTDASGAGVGMDTTDAQGRFSLSLEGGAGAVHFAAVRNEAGTLFVGPVFNGTDAPEDYRIVVRGDAPPGAVVMPDGSILPPVGGGTPAGRPAERSVGPEPPSRAATAAVFVLVTALLVAGLLWLRRRQRRRERREVLVELASLEEQHATLATPDPAPREAAEDDRASLRARLRDLPT